MGPTKTLGSYVSKAEYEDLPEEVIHQAKRCILDTIGCMLSGCTTSLGKNIISLAKDMGGVGGTSTIAGGKGKVSPVQAAFANAALADVLDWNDFLFVGHCGCGTIPAALAVGEMGHVSGRDLITAVVMGYEVMGRIGLAVQPTEARFMQLWGVPSWVPFAAAVSAGKILRLNESQMATAIGYAGAFAPVPASWKYVETRSDVYHCIHGWCSMAGVFAALHAKRSFGGMNTILDGKHGWWLMAGSDRCNFRLMTRGLGKEYLILKTLVKRFPSNLWNQSFLDALYEAIKDQRLQIEDVGKVRVSPHLAMIMTYKQAGIMDAEFSLPYNIALAILERKPSHKWYAEEKLSDPRVLDLISKVEVSKTQNFFMPFQCFSELWAGRWFSPVIVEIITRDQKHFKGKAYYPRGHPQNPLTDDELREKFRNASTYTLNCELVNELIKMVNRLEEVNDVSELVALFYP